MRVSCLMVTKPGREDLACRAIDDFYRQTHPYRDLIVVATAQKSYDALSTYIEDWTYQPRGREDATGVWTAPPARVFLESEAPLGALRNSALDEAAGAVICQWDDDDRHHPERVAVQLRALEETGRHSCFLTSQLYYYPTERKPYLYVVDWTLAPTAGSGILIPGTLLCRRSAVTYEPTLSRGEDTKFLQAEIKAHGRAATVDRPGLYARGWHSTHAWRTTTNGDVEGRNVQSRGWRKKKIEARLDELKADIRALRLPHDTIQLRAANENMHVELRFDVDLRPEVA
jgi:glycosyltransferase involved in cell wall biosynthesis